ncbi:DNA mismatch repair endonuclease MutL [Phormidium sp. CLA17]|uniref:DNA mismatch repair endonuclease MutL n=1 Tax=Leptolyngbya sp. Cla-17 TaxID=2803751 RepID=UPI0014926B6E|nr:DNA mismatch repair endonuclease MutL [Leptolyngbya sp. Cla-17]MBM0742606.1 DNA mismatch repair endonuclease MutL [Leptolyngbya sp. Cla-17]
MNGIYPLPTEVVHLIAAGEVIDSLAAAIRELVENSLDSGATRITVSIWAEQWRLRVADNGIGMNCQNLKQAASPHSTSKIRDRQDLWNITSLGFRGEALHSLAQLAQLQIASRPSSLSSSSNADSGQASEGWQVTYDTQGVPVEMEPVAIAPGTIVTVDHLFANLPTRRQGLPSVAHQLKAVQAIIYQIALCHPQVTWQVQQGDRDWFTLFPGSTARQILPQLLREVEVSDLQEMEQTSGDEDRMSGIRDQEEQLRTPDFAFPTPHSAPSLYLLLGLPDRCHRHRPDWVRVAVNGRSVNLPEIEQTILAAFRRTLPRDRYPVCFVHLQVTPAQVDWNRHPAKSEIYLHHLDDWRDQITAAIDQTLRLNPDTLPETLYSDRIGHLLKTAETGGVWQTSQPSSNLESGDQSASSTPNSQTSISLKALAQVHNTYILAEHPTGLWLIEQHIAHERVLYEQLCDRWQIVPLETPIILKSLTPAQVEQLQRIGIEVEPFGDQSWVARSAPALLAARSDGAEALIELSFGGDLQTAQVATACRSAIRNGTVLSHTAMQTLLTQWQQTRNPRTCPHGRPICLTLEESSLSRFFRRHWVIGKSHGIQ